MLKLDISEQLLHGMTIFEFGTLSEFQEHSLRILFFLDHIYPEKSGILLKILHETVREINKNGTGQPTDLESVRNARTLRDRSPQSYSRCAVHLNN